MDKLYLYRRTTTVDNSSSLRWTKGYTFISKDDSFDNDIVWEYSESVASHYGHYATDLECLGEVVPSKKRVNLTDLDKCLFHLGQALIASHDAHVNLGDPELDKLVSDVSILCEKCAATLNAYRSLDD